MKKEIIEELNKSFAESKKECLELNQETSQNVYNLLYHKWLKDYKPNLILRIFSPSWKNSVLLKTLQNAERETLPPCSEVDFKNIFLNDKIEPKEILFINNGLYNEPYKAVRKEYFLKNQADFWSAGDDIGIFDESFSWVINIDDSGKTSISKI